MNIHRRRDGDELSDLAAQHAAAHLRAVLAGQREARILPATGAS